MKGQYNPATIALSPQDVSDIQLTKQGDTKVSQSGLSVNLSASALVKTGAGNAVGVIINSHTNGTLKLWDNTSAATTILFNTLTFATAERWIPFFGAKFATGLYATIGGTADLTIIYN